MINPVQPVYQSTFSKTRRERFGQETQQGKSFGEVFTEKRNFGQGEQQKEESQKEEGRGFGEDGERFSEEEINFIMQSLDSSYRPTIVPFQNEAIRTEEMDGEEIDMQDEGKTLPSDENGEINWDEEDMER